MHTRQSSAIVSYFQNILPLLLIAGAIVALDQFTKTIVRANLEISDIWVPWSWLGPYARIVHWKNTGAAFGMLPGLSDIFTILAVVVSIAILYYFPRVPREDWLLRLAMCLQLGGAVGNLIDRLTQGWVTDFISVGALPVFNVADASITTGVVLLLLDVWLKERNKPASQAVTNTDPAPDSPGEPPAQGNSG
jgi:signal peptidase II